MLYMVCFVAVVVASVLYHRHTRASDFLQQLAKKNNLKQGWFESGRSFRLRIYKHQKEKRS